MNLSRRAKLDRETDARGGRRQAPPAAAIPEEAPPTTPAPEPVPESEAPVPAPAVAEERPKLPKFVRQASEKRAAASPAPLPAPSTKPAGKVMSRNLTVAPKPGAAGAKGPQAARGPIANIKRGGGSRQR